MNCQVSAIRHITVSRPSAVYYDLQGRPTKPTKHGIYIKRSAAFDQWPLPKGRKKEACTARMAR
jgi:hypothetical protein